MKKIIAAAILISSMNIYANDTTETEVPCSKVRGGGKEYGCGEDEKNIKNEAYKCLKKIPWEMTKFKKSATGKKAFAFEGEGEEISMLDGKTTYKIKKDDLLKKIKEKMQNKVDKKKAIVSMLTPEGGEVMMELDNTNGESSEFKFEKWKAVKRQLTEEEVKEKITYPIGINKKVADDDKNTDKAAKKFFEDLEESEKHEINKKEVNMKNIIETSDKGENLSPDEKRKMKEQARREFEKEKQIIKKKKEAAYRDMLAQADKCSKYIPDTVKFVKEKMHAQSTSPSEASSSDGSIEK